MRIPRLLVDVARHGDGWTVHVHGVRPPAGPATGPDGGRGIGIEAKYDLAAVLVTDVQGALRQVPALPVERYDELTAALPADLAALCRGQTEPVRDLLARISGLGLQPGDAELYGRWLFACLLAPVWPEILALAGHGDLADGDPADGDPASGGLAGGGLAGRPGVELALRWTAGDQALDSAVWESMHDGTAPLLGHPRILVAITRVVPAPTPAPSTIRRVPRVLLAAGSALSDPVIRPGAMFMGLLRAFEAEGLCVSWLMDRVTLTELGEACQRHQPDVVHLVAHGYLTPEEGAFEEGAFKDGAPEGNSDVPGGRPVIELAVKPAGARRSDAPTGSTFVDAELLAQALRGPAGMPTAVVLSACGSALPGSADGDGNGSADGGVARAAGRSMAAELVLRGVPVVVAMSGEISEQASRMFTRAFVRAVHEGASVIAAAAAGRRAALLSDDRQPSGYLDWAMPTLLLAEQVPPELQLVDPAPTVWLSGLAESLKLRHEPLFIGHEAVLDQLEDLVSWSPERGPGFVAAVAEGPVSGLGGTRLLQETGLRLLRAGHLPLLIGPFPDGGEPQDLPDVVREVLRQMVIVADRLHLDPRRLTICGEFPPRPAGTSAAADAPQKLDDRTRRLHILALHRAIGRTAADGALSDGEILRVQLGLDLASFADAAAALAAPFGPASRVVVLGDEVHRWGNALAPLLDLVTRDGLGEPDRPVPLVVTASLAAGTGGVLKLRRDKLAGQPGYRFPELAPLSRASAIMGFQWVLLHPWLPDRPLVYTAARDASPDKVEETFALLKVPTAVRRELYFMADILKVNSILVCADDELALRTYQARFR